MLKVVGASWMKTRISTYILAGAGLLAIGSLFLAEMERPTYDGTYCATVYWTKQTGFRVEFWGQQNDLQIIPKGVARTCYKDSTFDNGWSKIEIETQPTYPDWIQAFGAGILEGALTWKNIYNHWSNTIESYCDKDEKSQLFCTWLRDTIENNYETVKDLADQRGKHDHYWYQIRLFYYQLEGLELGWRQGVQRSRADLEIDRTDFLLLNAASDIRDLRIYYENFVHLSGNYEYQQPPPKASMLINFMRENGTIRKVLVGHSSDGSYSSMLRVLKKYKFHYHYNHDHKTPEVSGIDIAFTGYPGCISSTDDFYMIRGKKTKLTVGGIRIQNENLNLWRNVELENSVLLAARVMSANRLAHSGRSWAKVISRNPGFGIKQWFVIDVKRMHKLGNSSFGPLPNVVANQTQSNQTITTELFDATGVKNFNLTFDVYGNGDTGIGEEKRDETGEPNKEMTNSGKHLLWIIDQLPGRLHAEDMTQDIAYGSGFWTSNGLPYFKEMLEASQVHYDPSVRKQFYKIAANITDLDAVAKTLRSQAYRGDLMGENASAFGNIDIKLYSENIDAEMEFHALAGPIYYVNTNHHNNINSKDMKPLQDGIIDGPEVANDQLSEIEILSERRSIRDDIRAIALLKTNGPFKWSNTKLNEQHSGHPDVWNFNRVSPIWAWKHDNM